MAARRKHVPIRTCIGCRTSGPKQSFVRIVRRPDGRVVVDPTGKTPGRGAYLHASRACWENALKRGSIGRALKINPAPEDVEALRAYGMALPIGEGEAE